MANVECYDIWHGQLRHVNFNSIKRMTNMKLISKFNLDREDKSDFFVQVKQPRKFFNSVKSNSTLELIHSDICNCDNTLTR